MSTLTIPESISQDFELALKAVEDHGKGAIGLLTKAMLEGLQAEKAVGTAGNTMADYATRLNYVKFFAEVCHYVRPTPSGQDPNADTDEIVERLQRLLSGADTENPSEAESVGTASA